MSEVLVVSRWFYPADTSLLIWLTRCALLAFVAVVACWVLGGLWKKICLVITAALSGIGILVCLGMIAAESIVFEFSSPLSIAGYAALLVTFAWLVRQSRSERPLRIQCAASLALAGVAFAYLFFYGAIPSIAELQPAELEGVEGVNVLGARSGALPVIEFADFECPPCAAQDQIMDRLWRAYPDRIRYSFRHFPKPRHPHAEPAALASQCAAEQGTFWETKRLLFSNQNRLAEILAHPGLPTIPAGDTQKFAQCVQSRSAWGSVSRDRQWAENLGLRVTPSIIIGNKLIQGVTRYPRLTLIVRRELADRALTMPPGERAGREAYPTKQRTAAQSPSGCGSAIVAQGCSQ